MPLRPCVADDKIEAYMRRTKGFSLGLLLGHRSSSNLSDLVLAAVPTPPEQDGGKSTQLSDISIDWMVLHATQVLGYLPGGIDCLGMYVVARDAATSLNGIKLHRHMLALRQVQTRLKKSLHAISDDDCVQYIAVASPGVSPVFKALSKGNAMVPVDCKWQPDVATTFLRRFTCSIEVPIIIASPPSRSHTWWTTRLHRQLQNTISIADSSDHVTFLRALASSGNGTDDDGVRTCSTGTPSRSLQTIQGSIHCVAYVHRKTKTIVDVAADRLREDGVHSLATRLAALDNDDQSTDAEESPHEASQTMALPRRAVFSWCSGGVPAGFDGLLHVVEAHESLADSLSNAREVLGDASSILHATWVEEAAKEVPVWAEKVEPTCKSPWLTPEPITPTNTVTSHHYWRLTTGSMAAALSVLALALLWLRYSSTLLPL
ncbi:hypothetical protein H257_06499 [Aphanomyces astaci]|uniref:Uncharacterized protein n=1 Tax=Aphanomyces astaci TaxID=112090 RepID=W4GL94_APHAT|nr:hypothetical protein H257_06499 [Aphanomyces astaci]ETV80111.1 hypothetical protein H257_06499 [Aphanomyces astaci]|eukprot:XP_009830035.1 hypothetical protein H257_06499 [Aphanomyces astaci]